MSCLSTLRSNSNRGYVLDSDSIELKIRQQPRHALVTQAKREKHRKPIDPPPIVQMTVKSDDPNQSWLVSPYLFMIALLLDGEEGDNILGGEHLLGQNSSSLHRLKDVNNQDGGFFVFGDMSVKKSGTHRLRFILFNNDKDSGEVISLKTIETDPFDVVNGKEFVGLKESSALSRTFSDQGVRLRLRKQTHSLGGHSAGVKRPYPSSPQPSPSTPTQYSGYGGPVNEQQYHYGTPAVKRQRSDSEFNSPHTYPMYSSNFGGTNAYYNGSTMATGRSWTDQAYQQVLAPMNYSNLAVGAASSSPFVPNNFGSMTRGMQGFQQGSSSASIASGHTGGPSYSRTGSMGRHGYYGGSFQQPPAPSDHYPSQRMQNPTSIAPHHGQSYVSSSADFSPRTEGIGSLTNSLFTQAAQYQQDIPTSMYSQAGSLAVGTQSSDLTSGPPLSPSFDQHQSSMVQYPQSHQVGPPPSVQTPYQSYTASTGSMGQANLTSHLYESTLASEFAPSFSNLRSTANSHVSDQRLTEEQPPGYAADLVDSKWQQ